MGEVALIDAMKTWLGCAAEPVSPMGMGMGDDCAVLSLASGEQMLVSTDALLWGRHFDEQCPAEQAGAKLYKRNLSDIAAMGGKPAGAVVALLLGEDVNLSWLEGFYRGLAEVALRYGAPILGGDISSAAPGHFSATMTVLGKATRVLTRNSANVGDTLWVTGALGGSLHGRHLSFEPRLEAGQWLIGEAEVTAMMDVSDGLGKDLPALLGSAFFARLDREAIPIHDDARIMSKHSGKSVLEHVLNDGEDYELLFARTGRRDEAAFARRFKEATGLTVSCIGKVDTKDECESCSLIDQATGKPIAGQGYAHFL